MTNHSMLALTTTALAALGAVTAATTSALAQAVECPSMPEAPVHHFVPANNETVHWGYFSKDREPQAVIHSGDLVTIETLTHHANDDAERMVKGDPGAESVFRWGRGRFL